MTTPATGILIDDLTVTVRQEERVKKLLENIRLELPAGSFTAIVGASGCGKSTLLKSLCGLVRPQSGSIRLGGHGVRELKDQFPLAIGYLPQSAFFHPQSSVREILNTAARLRLPRSIPLLQREEWLQHLIQLSGLQHLLGQRQQTLSGGQLRRLALAEELVGDPSFLLLDELTSGLDEHSDAEMMAWLKDLAHGMGKTVVLVTHNTHHLQLCDFVVVLHQGKVAFAGPAPQLYGAFGVDRFSQVLQQLEGGVAAEKNHMMGAEGSKPEPTPLRTGHPPGGWVQLPSLIQRQFQLLLRDKAQLSLQAALALVFPVVVSVFALQGLPQVRNLNLALESNLLLTLQERLLYMQESFQAASLVSGLAMFQVILLCLLGANNSSREIAKEHGLLSKELRAGLSPHAYVCTKFLQVAFFSLLQAFWMTWLVKTVCGFPGSFAGQFVILFGTVLAMGTACLAISASSRSAERASLLAVYLVGFQLPLSGAALALPDWLNWVCRPFITAYWGWSGYLKTLESFRHYDIVRQSTETVLNSYPLCLGILTIHCVVCLGLAGFFVRNKRTESTSL